MKTEEFEWEIIHLDFAGRQIGRSGTFIGTKRKVLATLKQTIARELRSEPSDFTHPYFFGAYAKKIRAWERSKR